MKRVSYRDLFTCTFCRSISAGPPHILGRSARLTCEPCYKALLDLSICWVCGEMIFRGDECVSFGWCFWHLACYGCLLCGSRRVCAGVPVHALPGHRDDQGRGSAGRGEVAEPPLCAPCVIEVESAALDQEAVVRRGLRRVSMVDGGVTQVRWVRKQGPREDPARRDTAARETWRPGWAPHKDDAPVSTIWVDMHDPVNGESFRPSPLKPVPSFVRSSAVEGAAAADGLSTRGGGSLSPTQIDARGVSRGQIREASRRPQTRLRHSEPGPPPPAAM